MHTGATWRIQLNHPFAAAMRPCQIALTASIGLLMIDGKFTTIGFQWPYNWLQIRMKHPDSKLTLDYHVSSVFSV